MEGRTLEAGNPDRQGHGEHNPDRQGHGEQTVEEALYVIGGYRRLYRWRMTAS